MFNDYLDMDREKVKHTVQQSAHGRGHILLIRYYKKLMKVDGRHEFNNKSK